MEIYVCYGVLNEEEYLEYSLKSVYEFATKIIIIEGATPFTPLHKNYLSVDKTPEIIQNFPDTEKKINYIRYGKVANRLELQNLWLSQVPSGAWVLKSDADEIWEPNELRNVKGFVETNPKLVEVFPEQVEVRFDFKHYFPILWPKKPENIFFDRDGHKLCNGFVQERLYRKIDSNISYKTYHTHVENAHNYPLYGHNWYEKLRCTSGIGETPIFRFWHTSCMSTIPKYILKQLHIICQNTMKKSYSELNKEEREKAHWSARSVFLHRMWNPDGIKEHGYELPMVLKEHPYFEMTSHDIPDMKIYELSEFKYEMIEDIRQGRVT